jgi:hypothetical protein
MHCVSYNTYQSPSVDLNYTSVLETYEAEQSIILDIYLMTT